MIIEPHAEQSVVLATLLGLLLLSQVGAWVVLDQLVKQRGRLLLRLDDLEGRLSQLSQKVSASLRLGRRSQSTEQLGLPVGTRFPSFSLRNLEGQQVRLEDFQGKRVLLTHWSPFCGFCDLIAPDLARAGADFKKERTELVLVSHGEPEANRGMTEKHGLRCSVLLLARSQHLEGFERMGTPVAYLLDEEGRVAKPIAVGYEQVLILAHEIATGSGGRKRLPGERPLSESRIEREGIKAGTRAPVFALPDISGNIVSLEDYRGRPVLIVFTDPHCLPCDQLVAHLAELRQDQCHKSLDLIMIGRGNPDENRQKLDQYGFDFRVVVQKQWELSKAYGIFTTPAAFLVNEEGVIAEKVAVGLDEILSLVRLKEHAYG